MKNFVTKLYMHWYLFSQYRQAWISINKNIEKRRCRHLDNIGYRQKLYPVPEWGITVNAARKLLYLLFFIWFYDLSWRKYRQLAKDPESIETATILWKAFLEGFHSYTAYDFRQWLKRHDVSRQLALPQGRAPLALPEGRTTILEAEISYIHHVALRGCGQYFELYECHALYGLRKMRRSLSGYDLEIFEKLINQTGWDLSDQTYAASLAAERKLLE